MKRVIQDKKGAVFISVIFLLALFAILGTGILGLVQNNIRKAFRDRKSQSTYYIAESAIRRYSEYMNLKAQEILTITGEDELAFYTRFNTAVLTTGGTKVIYSDYEPQHGEIPMAELSISDITSPTVTTEQEHSYQIKCRAYFMGGVERTAVGTVKIKYGSNIIYEQILIQQAVNASDRVVITGGAYVDGDISSIYNGGSTGVIIINEGGSVNGNIYIKDEKYIDGVYDSDRVIVTDEENGNKKPHPVLPKIPEVVVSQEDVVAQNDQDRRIELFYNTYIHSITVDNNRKVTIDVGDRDIALRLDHLYVNNGYLNVEGTGKLSIYIKGEVVFGHMNVPTSWDTNDMKEASKHLDIYCYNEEYSDNDYVVLTNGNTFCGNLFIENADFYIQGGAKYYGNIISSGFKIEATAGGYIESDYIYAPSAEFIATGGANVTGGIVAKTFELTDGCYVKIKEITSITIPVISGGGTTVTFGVTKTEGAIKEK